MKKFLALFTVIALILTITAMFVSCGDNDSENNDAEAVTTTEAVVNDSTDSDDKSGDDSESQTSESLVTEDPYFDGVPDDTANDIIWTKNY